MSGFNMPPGVSQSELPGNDDDWCEEGDMQAVAVMTLRDYFAAKALPVLAAHYPAAKLHDSTWTDLLARGSYSFADAMLKARQQ